MSNRLLTFVEVSAILHRGWDEYLEEQGFVLTRDEQRATNEGMPLSIEADE